VDVGKVHVSGCEPEMLVAGSVGIIGYLWLAAGDSNQPASMILVVATTAMALQVLFVSHHPFRF
jgi:hypothetical protein